jgi:hypothetical protein
VGLGLHWVLGFFIGGLFLFYFIFFLYISCVLGLLPFALLICDFTYQEKRNRIHLIGVFFTCLFLLFMRSP